MNVEALVCTHTPMCLLSQGLLLMEELHWLVWVGFVERGMLVALLLDSAISLVDMLVVGLD